MWAEDNLKDYPYLLINPITDQNGNQAISGPVAYTRSAAIPPAMAALLQITETDMQDILGNPAGADKMVSNISGKAVEMIQARVDGQAFMMLIPLSRISPAEGFSNVASSAMNVDFPAPFGPMSPNASPLKI